MSEDRKRMHGACFTCTHQYVVEIIPHQDNHGGDCTLKKETVFEVAGLFPGINVEVQSNWCMYLNLLWIELQSSKMSYLTGMRWREWQKYVIKLSNRCWPCSYAATSRLSKRLKCCQKGTRELAAIIPEAATAGTPMPGMVLSPQQRRPGILLAAPGNESLPALIAGP